MMLLVLLALTQTQTTTTIQVHGQGFGLHNTFSFGETIRIDAVVKPVTFKFHAPTLTGDVNIFIDGVPTDVPVNNKGIAELVTSTLTVGPHTLDAIYNGDNNYGPSTATTVTITIVPAVTHTDLRSSAFFTTSTTTITFTAHVSTGWGSLWRGHSIPVTEGSVDFRVDGIVVDTEPVDGSGNATFSTTLTPGRHTIVAHYDGDTNFNPSTSCPVCVIVKQGTAPAPTVRHR